MSNIKLITVTNRPDYATTLLRTAELHGWDVACIETEWRGFGTKLIETYNYLVAHPEVEHFVFCDAFDVVVMGTPEEFEAKLPECRMLASAERGLWPPTMEMYRDKYTHTEQGFDFINSGLYYARSDKFIEIMESEPPFYESDDQEWMNMRYLDGDDIDIDNYQTVFNSHSHMHEGDYRYNGRVEIMGNHPVFVHKNGRSEDSRLDELVRGMLG